MSNIPKTKLPSKNKVIDQLLADNLTLSSELKKHQECEIKLPMDPSISQINRVINWVDSVKGMLNKTPEPELIPGPSNVPQSVNIPHA